MPIKFSCVQCKKSISAPYEMAGAKGKCPRCGSIVHIPALESDKSVNVPYIEELFECEIELESETSIPQKPPLFFSPPHTDESIGVTTSALQAREESANSPTIATIASWIMLGWSGFCLFGIVVSIIVAAINSRPAYMDAEAGAQAIGVGLGLSIWLVTWAAIVLPCLVIWIICRKS